MEPIKKLHLTIYPEGKCVWEREGDITIVEAIYMLEVIKAEIIEKSLRSLSKEELERPPANKQ